MNLLWKVWNLFYHHKWTDCRHRRVYQSCWFEWTCEDCGAVWGERGQH
jgi:hypothetical protein